MNKHTIQGAIDQAVGGVKSEFGKATGNLGIQTEGAIQQIKGKVESAVGEIKDHLAKPPASGAPRSGNTPRR